MELSFDLISDLHVETWSSFDWTHQATSPYCVVAGDVARDRAILIDTLQHLSKCYQAVFYIDGNEEHRNYLDDLGVSYRALNRSLSNIKNLVYLQDNVVIIDGVAIVSTNGWWCYDFDQNIDPEQVQAWYKHKMEISDHECNSILAMGANDAGYLASSIEKLQTHRDVKEIVVVTHTVPLPELVNHDIELCDTYRFNITGNEHLKMALDADTEGKIKTWCFGHYHGSVDRIVDGIRYVNNCRGRANTNWCQTAYYPKRITISY